MANGIRAWLESRDAAQRQAGREERCDNCARDSAINAFRMDELDAVMLSTDKWLDGSALKNNPATRAADAREVALKAIEKEQARADKLDQRYAALVENVKGTCKAIIYSMDQAEMRGNDERREHILTKNYAERLLKALSELDEGRRG
jgi:hypothetical protein